MRRIAFLIAPVILLAACQAKIDQTLTVNADGSGDFAAFIAFDQDLTSLLEMSGEDVFAELRETPQDLPFHLAIEDMTEEGFTGVVAKAVFSNLGEGRTIIEEFGLSTGRLDLTREEDAFRFAADLQLEPPQEFEDYEDLEISSFLLLPFRVKLPGTVTEHNADRVLADGTLVWDLDIREPRTLTATSELSSQNTSQLIAIVAVVAFFLTLVLALAFISRRLNRRDESLNPDLG